MLLTAHTKWLRVLQGSFGKLGKALVATLFLAGLQLPAPLLTMRILNSAVSTQPDLQRIPLFIGFLIALFFVTQSVTACQRLVLEHFRIEITQGVERLLLKTLLRLPLSFLSGFSHGQLLARLDEDPQLIDRFFSEILLTSINDIATLSLGITLLFYINWRLASLALVSIPFSAVLIFKLRRTMKSLIGDLQDGTTRLTALLAESLSNVMSIKTLALETCIADRYDDSARLIAEKRTKILKARIVYESLVTTCSSITSIFILAYAAYGIAHRAISVGAFVAFTGYLAYLYRPADSLVISVLNAQGALQAAERVSTLVNEPPEVNGFVPAFADEHTHRDVAVRFEHVYFRYNASNGWVLRDVSCEFNSGCVTAISGPSGCGKTSMVNLIPQLIQPCAGSVSTRGLTYQSLEDLRKLVSVVSQDTFLFAGSVSENIAMGLQSVDRLDIENAARLACVDEWLLSDRALYSTTAEAGRSLSAGQRQRILIARAILRRPRILILDEATSCLDLDNERRVMTNLRSSAIPVIIVVSHRKTVLDLADWVYFVSQGQVIDVKSGSNRSPAQQRKPILNSPSALSGGMATDSATRLDSASQNGTETRQLVDENGQYIV